ncbi:MAG TPA: hypothetical protein VJM50_24775 [Pyrinomonadaceae bacterium]|nr:hypothetical protein [Pyrinomonadaceae bacterium]
MAAPWARGAIVRIVGRLHGAETVNVFTMATNTVVNDGPNLDQLLLDLAVAMRECVTEFLLPAVTSDWTFIQCDARAIHPTPSDPVVASALTGSVGERGPTSVSFAASLVNIRTGIGGRRGRGRKFLPPPGEADMTASGLDDATLVLIAAFLACVAEKFIGASATAPWKIGVLSRTSMNSIGGTFDNSFREATQLSPVKLTSLLSSRKVGKGS